MVALRRQVLRDFILTCEKVTETAILKVRITRRDIPTPGAAPSETAAAS